MKKLKAIVVIGIIVAFFVLPLQAVASKSGKIRQYTEDYIESLGYPVDSISNIEIDHSYINRILGYNEWRIFVDFEKEKNATFCFTYKNKMILFQGVHLESMTDKEKVIEYSEKFKSGRLLDD